MRLAGLNFDQVPSLDVPFRFYLSAPFFAVLAGILLACFGADIWASRWSPAAFAITHLLALGVMAMIMFGSLFQLLPVLCGTPIRINSKTLTLFLISFSSGLLCLIAGFFQLISYTASLVLLGASLILFASLLLTTLIRFAGGQFTRLPILFAVISLMITLLMGIAFLANFSWGFLGALPKYWTNIHASFGIFGWVTLLIVTISFQVIPMFHVTPEFPQKVRSYLPFLLFASIVLMSVEQILWNSHFSFVITWLFLASYSLFALKQLALRKRKLPDNTVRFWQFALANLILSTALLLVVNLFELPVDIENKVGTLAAIILALGCILSVIQGMLLKIIPFLITLHLQQHAMKYPMGMGLMPDHYSLIGRKQGTNLWYLHIATYILVISSIIYAPILYLAGSIFAFSWGYLWWLLLSATKSYYKIRIAIENC